MLNIGLAHFDKFYLRTEFFPYLLCFALGLLFMYAIKVFETGTDAVTPASI